jgi:phasin family protein
MATKKKTAKAATNVVEMKKPAAKKTAASSVKKKPKAAAKKATPKAIKKAPAKAVKKTVTKAPKKPVKTVAKKTVKKAAPKVAKKKIVTKKAATKKVAKVAVKKKAVPKKILAKKRKVTLKTKPKARIKTAQKPQTKSQAKPQPQSQKAASSAAFTQAMPDMTQFLNMETLMPNQNFKLDQISQDATNATREGTEAFLQSGAIFAKGFETILKTAAAMTQSAVEKQTQFAQEIMSSKTLNEAAEAQNKIAQANFDEFMSSATTLSEMSVKLLNDSAAPMNEQMTKAMQKAQKMAA